MFSQCDCSSTGGCERCRPIGMAVDQRIIVREEPEYKPSPRFDPKNFTSLFMVQIPSPS